MYIIDAISDTHMQHKALKLRGGDLLIHAGDSTHRGEFQQIIDFLNWLEDQDYKNIVLIPGNHDFGFEENFQLYKEECSNRGIVLLNDSGIEIDGIKIWGSAITPWFHDWAFNRHRGDDIRKHWALIPEDTDVLVTHGPPMGILDYIPYQNLSVGCADLYDRIFQTKVKLHVFGHIHEGRGYKYKDGKTFVNPAVLDGRYRMIDRKGTRITLDAAGDYLVEDPILDRD